MQTKVEILGLHDYSTNTGIGRYVTALLRHLPPSVSIQIKAARLMPFSKHLTFLKSLPIGIQDHEAGSIVHFPQTMGCGLVLWKPHRPTVATVHDLAALELPEELATLDPIARQIMRLSLAGLKRMDVVMAVSEYTRQSVIEHLGIPPQSVITVYSGVNHRVFKPELDAERKLLQRLPILANCPRPWLLYVGSDLPRKNLATLLQALAILKETYPHLRLLKIGAAVRTHFRKETKALIAALKLKENVLFIEDVSDIELALCYNAADLLVHPSRLEGFGFPVLEAMACGTPVVCSYAGSLPEIAGDATFKVDSHDADGLAGAIIHLLGDQDAQADLITRGIAQAATFTWGQTAEKVAQIYRSLS